MSSKDAQVTEYGGGVTRVQYGVDDSDAQQQNSAPFAKDGTTSPLTAAAALLTAAASLA